jgi:hypothetical protein
MIKSATHEILAIEERGAPGSERSFAVVMAIALTLLACLNWWHDGGIWPWLGGFAALFLVFGFLCPVVLKPLNRFWFKIGILLHAVVSPIIMALVFYGAVVPTGLIMRALGKDPLRLKIERELDSYWVLRQPPGPDPTSMKDQF